jgi:hypothetical protein
MFWYENFKIIILFGNFKFLPNSKSDIGSNKKMLKCINKQIYK